MKTIDEIIQFISNTIQQQHKVLSDNLENCFNKILDAADDSINTTDITNTHCALSIGLDTLINTSDNLEDLNDLPSNQDYDEQIEVILLDLNNTRNTVKELISTQINKEFIYFIYLWTVVTERLLITLHSLLLFNNLEDLPKNTSLDKINEIRKVIIEQHKYTLPDFISHLYQKILALVSVNNTILPIYETKLHPYYAPIFDLADTIYIRWFSIFLHEQPPPNKESNQTNPSQSINVSNVTNLGRSIIYQFLKVLNQTRLLTTTFARICNEKTYTDNNEREDALRLALKNVGTPITNIVDNYGSHMAGAGGSRTQASQYATTIYNEIIVPLTKSFDDLPTSTPTSRSNSKEEVLEAPLTTTSDSSIGTKQSIHAQLNESHTDLPAIKDIKKHHYLGNRSCGSLSPVPSPSLKPDCQKAANLMSKSCNDLPPPLDLAKQNRVRCEAIVSHLFNRFHDLMSLDGTQKLIKQPLQTYALQEPSLIVSPRNSPTSKKQVHHSHSPRSTSRGRIRVSDSEPNSNLTTNPNNFLTRTRKVLKLPSLTNLTKIKKSGKHPLDQSLTTETIDSKHHSTGHIRSLKKSSSGGNLKSRSSFDQEKHHSLQKLSSSNTQDKKGALPTRRNSVRYVVVSDKFSNCKKLSPEWIAIMMTSYTNFCGALRKISFYCNQTYNLLSKKESYNAIKSLEKNENSKPYAALFKQFLSEFEDFRTTLSSKSGEAVFNSIETSSLIHFPLCSTQQQHLEQFSPIQHEKQTKSKDMTRLFNEYPPEPPITPIIPMELSELS